MAPGRPLAPPTPSRTPKPVEGDWLPSIDRLAAHHYRLESLLDSALATVTLILDTATTTTFSAHTTDVLHALYQCTMVATSRSPTPSPTPALVSAPPAPPTATKTATYADAVAATPDRAGANADKVNTTKMTKPGDRIGTAPDIVLRIDSLPSPLGVRPPPTALYATLANKPFEPDIQVAGVRWTRNGNLTITFIHDDKYMADGAMDLASSALWKRIEPLLHLPKDCPVPRIDCGKPWHSVVIHDAPMLLPDEPRYEPAYMWLRRGGFRGNVMHVSYMGKQAPLCTGETGTVRISLETRAEAEFLVRNGALVFGSRCWVSHFVAKPRDSSPRSTSAPP
ncbi:hypothetical protein MSAN_02089000 [Mycena sanguinolenta]|uniref:Uncharacterized protein n=1 Tax=Mycena sanguinolenta TaxID=230812 RepID=A0A8H6XIC3_9AGAR|nr:hypothetical protein MSAN_02089000 [Mycena sanguinolenta]